jgi:hypothetical protein
MNSCTAGSIGELVVAADLLSLGFQVFRNVTPRGIDLVAYRDGQFLKIEVKTVAKARPRACGISGRIARSSPRIRPARAAPRRQAHVLVEIEVRQMAPLQRFDQL